ncbi:hypothetical protein D3C73_891230 [compost metagenome]
MDCAAVPVRAAHIREWGSAVYSWQAKSTHQNRRKFGAGDLAAGQEKSVPASACNHSGPQVIYGSFCPMSSHILELHRMGDNSIGAIGKTADDCSITTILHHKSGGNRAHGSVGFNHNTGSTACISSGWEREAPLHISAEAGQAGGLAAVNDLYREIERFGKESEAAVGRCGAGGAGQACIRSCNFNLNAHIRCGCVCSGLSGYRIPTD